MGKWANIKATRENTSTKGTSTNKSYNVSCVMKILIESDTIKL